MMNETKRSPTPYLLLTLLAMAVLNGTLIIIRAEVTSTTAIMVLYYACSLLSLFVTMIGIGAALFYLARGLAGMACRVLLLTEGASLLPLLAAAVRTAFDYPDYFTDALVTEILSAIGNTILMTGVHLLLLLLCRVLYFRHGIVSNAPRLSPMRNRQGLANLTVVGVLFLYQVIAETVEMVDFITTYWPNVYRNEIASIIFSYVYLVLSLLLGYVIQYGTQTLLHDAYKQ